MNEPNCVFVDHLGRLWVSDADNGRVLRFSDASNIATYSAADRVYGQQDFTTRNYDLDGSRIISPASVWVDKSDRLWICDESACRVLRFDNVSSKASGAAADGVLGHADFTTGGQGSGAAGLDRPVGIVVSLGVALFVACERGNRVLRFTNAANLANGANADAVIGQSDFSGSSGGTTATTMFNPSGLAFGKDDSLWVCDEDNSRLLRFDKASTKTSGAAADGVVGQADFESNSSATTAQGLYYPTGNMWVDDEGDLWAADSANNRVLRFPAVISQPTLTVTSKAPQTTKKKKLKIKGIATDPNSIISIKYQSGSGPLKTAAGTTNWSFTQKLKKGKNRITIYATDIWGDTSVRRVIRIKRK
jgi:sugar lactone lactonase YvrE